MRISSIYPITMGKHSLSDELHRWGTGSSQRPLTESSSPWHPTPGRRCLRWKTKGVSSPFTSIQAQFHLRNADMSTLHCGFLLIYMYFPSPEVWRSLCEVVKQVLGQRICCAVHTPSHHGEESSLCTALQLLRWWWLSSLSSALPALRDSPDLSQKENSDGSIHDFSHATTLPKDFLILIFLMLISSCIELTVLIDFE